jgi:hypothetical protein
MLITGKTIRDPFSVLYSFCSADAGRDEVSVTQSSVHAPNILIATLEVSHTWGIIQFLERIEKRMFTSSASAARSSRPTSSRGMEAACATGNLLLDSTAKVSIQNDVPLISRCAYTGQPQLGPHLLAISRLHPRGTWLQPMRIVAPRLSHPAASQASSA